MGGPGNSVDRNHHYSIKKDTNFIVVTTSNTSVGFINLFKKHDKLWMKRKVMSLNLCCDQALLGLAIPT